MPTPKSSRLFVGLIWCLWAQISYSEHADPFFGGTGSLEGSESWQGRESNEGNGGKEACRLSGILRHGDSSVAVCEYSQGYVLLRAGDSLGAVSPLGAQWRVVSMDGVKAVILAPDARGAGLKRSWLIGEPFPLQEQEP